MSTSTLILGSRTSDLALWQSNHIISRLQAAWPTLTCRIEPFITQGDRTQAQGKALPAIGGKGLFTAELEDALCEGRIDIAVHSLKDLPVEDSPGLTLGAITTRADVRDALVARNGWTLATLPSGAVVGTSSTRRAAQLLAQRPDLTIRTIRGNVPTRVRKVHDGDYDATLLAAAGLERLGLLAHVTELLAFDLMLPAPGQGALAVQCRAADTQTLAILAAVNDEVARAAVTAERAFLHGLGGGCSAPVAAYATGSAGHALQLTALVGSTDGKVTIRVADTSRAGEDANALGERLAQQALADGAAALLTQARTGAGSGIDVGVNHRASPLQGKRIVVTRAQEQASNFSEALTALGATPLLIPTIRVDALPDLSALDVALQQLAAFDWLILTSVNGVAILAERLTQLAIPNSAWQGVQVAAVGSATAEALRAQGILPTFVPEQYVAEAIIDGLGNVAGQRILLPQAAIARETLAERLVAAGALVDAIPIYQTSAADLDGDALQALGKGVDVITFTSSSTVRNLVTALTAATGSTPHFERETIACIGPVTAETARELGLHVDVVATEHTVPGLVTALTAHFAKE